RTDRGLGRRRRTAQPATRTTRPALAAGPLQSNHPLRRYTMTFAHQLTRDAAARVAKAWWLLLLNCLALIVAGVLVFSIDWTVNSLATFIGALFIFEGV